MTITLECRDRDAPAHLSVDGVHGADAQTLEATVVYGDGADVKGGGLDIEGIEEDNINRRGNNAHKSSHHGGAFKDEVSKQRVAAVTGGGSLDVRLGGDRYGVGLVDKNKVVHHGSRGSSAMMRGGGEENIVQVGNTYKTNGGRSKYVYQTGTFASLSNGRPI